MRKKTNSLSLRELSALLWLYATEIFDPEYGVEQSTETGLDKRTGESMKNDQVTGKMTRKGTV